MLVANSLGVLSNAKAGALPKPTAPQRSSPSPRWHPSSAARSVTAFVGQIFFNFYNLLHAVRCTCLIQYVPYVSGGPLIHTKCGIPRILDCYTLAQRT
jgi:hypothetical protein